MKFRLCIFISQTNQKNTHIMVMIKLNEFTAMRMNSNLDHNTNLIRMFVDIIDTIFQQKWYTFTRTAQYKVQKNETTMRKILVMYRHKCTSTNIPNLHTHLHFKTNSFYIRIKIIISSLHSNPFLHATKNMHVRLLVKCI